MIILPEFDLSKIEPLHIQGVRDYHVHCEYSVDAVGSIADYCEAALARNLAEICFTTHFDANPDSDKFANFLSVDGEQVPTTIENLKPYIEEVLQKAEEFYLRGLSVKLGVEFGWFDNGEQLAAKLKETYPFDYFLCGVHEIENICYCSRTRYRQCFDRYTMEEAVEKYYQSVTKAVQTGLFDTIAHLDYYIKYGKAVYGAQIMSAHKPYIEDVFQVLNKYHCGLEINTSGIRHRTDDYFPRIELVNQAKKQGVTIEYLGSDAHTPLDIGYEFELAASLVPDTIRGCED